MENLLFLGVPILKHIRVCDKSAEHLTILYLYIEFKDMYIYTVFHRQDTLFLINCFLKNFIITHKCKVYILTMFIMALNIVF